MTHMTAGQAVTLSMNLPGVPEPISADAHSCYLRESAIGTRVIGGFQMPKGRGVSPHVRRALTRYVMARQRELARLGLIARNEHEF